MYDMLAWMTMDPALAVDNHLSGTANPIYTSMATDRFFWTKTGNGYPWDIQLFDDNYIYLWVTELDWSNPRSFKMFNSPTLGYYNEPLAPRYSPAGYPGSSIKITDTTYEIHTDCDTFTTHHLGYGINEVWGPYTESLGGDLPDNLTTMVISYRYTCNPNYDHCGSKEAYHFAQPYGLVEWEHFPLQADDTYGKPDNVTIFNKLVPGQVKVDTVCFPN